MDLPDRQNVVAGYLSIVQIIKSLKMTYESATQFCPGL